MQQAPLQLLQQAWQLSIAEEPGFISMLPAQLWKQVCVFLTQQGGVVSRPWQLLGMTVTLEAAAAALFGKELGLEQDNEHTDGSSSCGARGKI